MWVCTYSVSIGSRLYMLRIYICMYMLCTCPTRMCNVYVHGDVTLLLGILH